MSKPGVDQAMDALDIFIERSRIYRLSPTPENADARETAFERFTEFIDRRADRAVASHQNYYHDKEF